MAFYIEELEPDFKSWLSIRPTKKEVGMLFRNDREKSGINIPRDNHDISRELGHVEVKGRSSDVATFRAGIANKTRNFFARVAEFQEIWTNRLHVCIAAAMLGREAHCWPNNYWKNQAMFDYSIRGRYPNAHFEADGCQSQIPQ